jgi:histidyl-tRNA synthetase
MKIQRCKGMRDLAPDEMAVFRRVEGACLGNFGAWGYREVRTPTIEHLHLFTSAGTLTPGQLSKVYSFLDWDGWSGERVVLRPDGTIPVARFYADELAGYTARLAYSSNIFMFQEDGDKPRERWQCGVELIGDGTDAADAELVSLSLETLDKLGVKNVEVRLSHAGLVMAMLEKLSLGAEEQHKAFDRILDGDAAVLTEAGKASPELAGALKPLVEMRGQTPGFLKNQAAALPPELADLKPHLEDFLGTVAALDELGVKYRISLASGAGFEYYTGLIFQLFTGGEKIGGGGRYDALIAAMGGGDAPAAGFALYLDQIVKLVKPQAVQRTGAVCVRLGAGLPASRAFETAAGLREAGYAVVLDPRGEQEADHVVEVNEVGLVYAGITCASVAELLARMEG